MNYERRQRKIVTMTRPMKSSKQYATLHQKTNVNNCGNKKLRITAKPIAVTAQTISCWRKWLNSRSSSVFDKSSPSC